MARTRREFFRDAAVSAAAASLLRRRSARAETHEPASPATAGPSVIATWDYGVELCAAAQKVFAAGGDLLDALEKGVNVVESDPKVMSVGYGGLPNEDGVVQLDAAIMDGRTHKAGCVAALEGIKNPISVARKVMERTEHVLLVGAGALAFARKMGFKEEELLTAESRAAWQKAKASFWKGDVAERHDTVACIGRDAAGNLATAVSTSGLPWKLAGRTGDSPIIGAGSYVDNEIGAAAATGIGELAICNAASFAIVERMRAGVSPTRACEEILARVIQHAPRIKTDVGAQLAFIAMNKSGVHGAAALRLQKKRFRYALARGTSRAPVLTDVPPLL